VRPASLLPQDQQSGATPFAPRTTKDVIEEQLFAQRRDLFSSLDLVFFDTTSLCFYGEGGATLGEATPTQRNKFEIIGDGFYVHWPEVDEDPSVEGMLHGVPAPRPKK